MVAKYCTVKSAHPNLLNLKYEAAAALHNANCAARRTFQHRILFGNALLLF